MRGRQIIDATFAARRLRIVSHIETDSVRRAFAHAAAGQWTSIVLLTVGCPAAAPRDSCGRDPLTIRRWLFPVCITHAAKPATVLARAAGRDRGRVANGRPNACRWPTCPDAVEIGNGYRAVGSSSWTQCRAPVDAGVRPTSPVSSGGADPTASLEFERSRENVTRDSNDPSLSCPGEDLEGSVAEGVHGILQRKSTGFPRSYGREISAFHCHPRTSRQPGRDQPPHSLPAASWSATHCLCAGKALSTSSREVLPRP